VTDTGLASTGGKMYMIFDKRTFFGCQVFDDASGDREPPAPRVEQIIAAAACNGNKAARPVGRVLRGLRCR
jgi:hypothetical protein